MDTTLKSFNEVHLVGPLVKKGTVAVGLPTKPEEIDLRFLRIIRFSDTWEGDGAPVDGTVYIAVLYGNQIAWETNKWYESGSREMRSEVGNNLYFKLYHASMLYKKIQLVGRALFFREKLEKGADAFYMSVDDIAILQEHPQFKEMVADFGLGLKMTDKSFCFRVTVSRFHEQS